MKGRFPPAAVVSSFPLFFASPLWLVWLAMLLQAVSGVAWGAGFGPADQPMEAAWRDGKLWALVTPLADEGYIPLAKRVLEDPARHGELAAVNRNRPVQRGRAVKIPLEWLKPDLRGAALRAMYPEDDLTQRGWEHRVGHPQENLIQLTLVYTGSTGRFKELAAYNRLKNPNRIPLGQAIVIPLAWIPESMGFHPQVKAPLVLDRDPQTGAYFAWYTLGRDETLYSSVIQRFTNRERSDEVNRLAKELLALNGLKGARAIPAGQKIRIPLEWLDEEYLTGGASRPVAQHTGPQPGSQTGPQSGTHAPPTVTRPPGRPGRVLHVIVDPGHGGRDTGAVYGKRKAGGRVYENLVTYDIALRLERQLKVQGHRVYLTLEDPGQPAPLDQLPITPDHNERVKVTPPYAIASPNVGVNMRVYLINHLYRKLLSQGVRSEDIVFISIHGDALAKGLRGAMVYYPDHRLRQPLFHPAGREYRLRREAVKASLRFQPAQTRAAQEQSHAFARLVADGLAAQEVGVNPRRPLRSYYYRKGERTLPAVLRYSQVPASVLVEVANLNNAQDRQWLLTGEAREHIALGLAHAVEAKRKTGQTLAER
ncbi:MAG: N-acetylmuramoyl-L-alanine amidase [Deltaproteobacteria bacterium]|nr:N-acetylmuramoyl-L-alanine amidase [Deltaproteobacteria bacterium]